MLRQIRFNNWKSYANSSLTIDQLTVLVGTNASGKSNALDALDFLSRTANSNDVYSSIVGTSTTPNIRGGLEWAAHKAGPYFSLTAVTNGKDIKTDYEYTISVSINERTAEVLNEQLVRVKYQGKKRRELRLFWTDDPDEGAPGIVARLYNTKAGTKQPVRRNISVLSQLEIHELRDEIKTGIKFVLHALRNIFILDINPSSMRSYSRPSEVLFRDASNVAGVLTALHPEEKFKAQDALTRYAKGIPEKDILEVWAETVDRHNVDAMLYCKENWGPNKETVVDARGMSEGTLRFIAVVVALLTRPTGSLIVIEEIDNGLHPSRAVDLLKAIREIGEARSIDLLITTHNVALLDALPPGVFRSVAVATRSDESGASEITVLDDLPYLSRLIAQGSLGQLAARGRLEEAVKEQRADA